MTPAEIDALIARLRNPTPVYRDDDDRLMNEAADALATLAALALIESQHETLRKMMADRDSCRKHTQGYIDSFHRAEAAAKAAEAEAAALLKALRALRANPNSHDMWRIADSVINAALAQKEKP